MSFAIAFHRMSLKFPKFKKVKNVAKKIWKLQKENYKMNEIGPNFC